MIGVLRLFFICAIATIATPVFAATLYIEQAEGTLRPGDSLVLAVRIDTEEDECINVVDAVIDYSPSIELVDYSLGNSILPFWVEEPTINQTANQITFAGGIPNGYCGRIDGDPRLSNIVAELIFQTPSQQLTDLEAEPTAYVSFAPQTQVLLNDGAGTVANTNTLGSTIAVYATPGSSTTDAWRDRIENDVLSPRSFSVSLNNNLSVYGGRYFIVFNTTDKESGIDHYEVIEEPIDEFDLFNWGGVDAPWIEARSPYLLDDQSLNSTIRVKAIDKAGNEYIAVLVPDEALRGINARRIVSTVLAVGGLLILVTLVGGLNYYRRKQKFQEQQYREAENFTGRTDNDSDYDT
ncbi:hypothetical protein N9L26_00230 [Candidatus Pacebacteria bacterium]|nr:hypothetical protein [Candidatus Paceibacterota bacterium]